MRYFTFTELMEMAAHAKQPVEVIVKVGMELEEKERRENEARRATPEDKAKLHAALAEMAAEGRLDEDTPTADILTRAGVPHRQGTASVVSFARKKLLISAA